jgi:hypothetical protein
MICRYDGEESEGEDLMDADVMRRDYQEGQDVPCGGVDRGGTIMMMLMMMMIIIMKKGFYVECLRRGVLSALAFLDTLQLESLITTKWTKTLKVLSLNLPSVAIAIRKHI